MDGEEEEQGGVVEVGVRHLSMGMFGKFGSDDVKVHLDLEIKRKGSAGQAERTPRQTLAQAQVGCQRRYRLTNRVEHRSRARGVESTYHRRSDLGLLIYHCQTFEAERDPRGENEWSIMFEC